MEFITDELFPLIEESLRDVLKYRPDDKELEIFVIQVRRYMQFITVSLRDSLLSKKDILTKELPKIPNKLEMIRKKLSYCKTKDKNAEFHRLDLLQTLNIGFQCTYALSKKDATEINGVNQYFIDKVAKIINEIDSPVVRSGLYSIDFSVLFNLDDDEDEDLEEEKEHEVIEAEFPYPRREVRPTYNEHLPKEMCKCLICLELFLNPVAVIPSGDTYCEECINAWVKKNGMVDPISRKTISGLVGNKTMWFLMNNYISQE